MKKEIYDYQTFQQYYFDESVNQIKFKEKTEKRIKSPREIKIDRIQRILLWSAFPLFILGAVLCAVGDTTNTTPLIICGILCICLLIPVFVVGSCLDDKITAIESEAWAPCYEKYQKIQEQAQAKCERWRRAHPLEETARKIMEDNNSVELANIIRDYLGNINK